MAPVPLKVAIVPPLESEGWVSIECYVAAIEQHAPGATIHVSTLRSFGNESMGRMSAYRARYRELPGRLADSTAQADVVHVSDQALGHVVPFINKPTVVTCHDLMPIAAEGHYRSTFEGWFDRTLLRRSLSGMAAATRIIAVSETTAREIVRLLPINPEKISVVPNIVAPAFRKVSEPAAWLEARGIRLPSRPRILSVGHSRPYKNLGTLISAIARPELREATLVRCGAPLTADQRQSVAQLGLEERVVELGHCHPDELRAVYSACDVLAQPSRAEGFGAPVIEAMACELPVVCSDAEALNEVAGTAAHVVALTGRSAEHAAKSLAEGLHKVLADARVSCGLRAPGLERASDFSPSNVVPRLTAVYEQAVAETRA